MATQASLALRREAERAVRRMGRIEGLDGVLLFGSVAAGTAQGNSDVDLAVVGSERACRIARRRLRELMESETDIVEMTSGNDYDNANVRGYVGHEAIRKGTWLKGGSKEIDPYGEERAMNLEEVALEQGLALDAVEEMCRKWSNVVEAKERSAREAGLATLVEERKEWKLLARQSVRAAEAVATLALKVRGISPTPTKGHALGRLVRDIEDTPAGERGPRVIAEREGEDERLKGMIQEMNGKTNSDHLSIYPTRNPSEEHHLRRRVRYVLEHAREEHGALTRARGMEGLGEAVQRSVDRMLEAMTRIETGKDIPLAQQAVRWRQEFGVHSTKRRLVRY